MEGRWRLTRSRVREERSGYSR
jgi:hypothetical protein